MSIAAALVAVSACGTSQGDGPTAAQCEAQTTKEACINAGCQVFEERATFGTAQFDEVGEAVCDMEDEPRSMCLRMDPKGSQDTIGVYYRDVDSTRDEVMIISFTAPHGLHGWTECEPSPTSPACACYEF